MSVHTLRRDQLIPRPMHQVFSFFADAANLQAITPPWLNFHILTPGPIAMHAGTRLHYRLKWRGVPILWETAIVTWSPPHLFSDEQVRGPYRLWRHVHSFHPDPAGTRMIDMVSYELPLGPIGEIAHSWTVKRDLDRIFNFRARVIADAFPPQADVHR